MKEARPSCRRRDRHDAGASPGVSVSAIGQRSSAALPAAFAIIAIIKQVLTGFYEIFAARFGSLRAAAFLASVRPT
jgi:hypothetical protein